MRFSWSNSKQVISKGAGNMEFQQRLEAAYAQAETSREEAFGKRRAEWISRLETEHDNLSRLLQELLARKDTEAGLRLTCLLEEMWFEAPYTAEGLDWFRCFLALPTAATQTALRASGLDLAGAYALQLGTIRKPGACRKRLWGFSGNVAILYRSHIRCFTSDISVVLSRTIIRLHATCMRRD